MLCEFHTIRREPVEMRRRHVAVMKCHIRPAEIVGEEENEIRLRCSIREERCKQ
jgi:hypothetical protein